MERYYFFYGSLRVGLSNHARYLQPLHLPTPRPATLSGQLYRVQDAYYPAFQPNGTQLVSGDAYPESAISTTLKHKLDELEDYHYPGHPHNLYEPRWFIGQLTDTNQIALFCTYVFCDPHITLLPLDCGDWYAYSDLYDNH